MAGLERVADGTTTLEELERVLGDVDAPDSPTAATTSEKYCQVRAPTVASCCVNGRDVTTKATTRKRPGVALNSARKYAVSEKRRIGLISAS